VKLAANYGVRHIMIAAWMRQAIDGLAVGSTVRPNALRLLARGMWRGCTPRSGYWRCSVVYSQGLRSISVEPRRETAEPAHHSLSIEAQCRLLSVSRSSLSSRSGHYSKMAPNQGCTSVSSTAYGNGHTATAALRFRFALSTAGCCAQYNFKLNFKIDYSVGTGQA
jgi:hypothetical protein